jgi:hypothetical protein
MNSGIVAASKHERRSFMKLVLKMLVATVLVHVAFSVSAMAGCGGGIGWATPSSDAAAISMTDAQAKALKELGVNVTKSEAQAMCGSDHDYKVIDAASGQYLGMIPVPYTSEKDNDGRFLWARSSQLMQTPRESLISLDKARDRFYEDTKGLEADLGLSAYVPNALPIESRTANNGQDYLLYVTIKTLCSDRGYQSPGNIYNGLAIKTIEYLPGRTDYSPTTIYQTGDLRKAIVANDELFSEVQKSVSTNMQFCRDDNTYFDGKEFWQTVSKRLASGKSSALKTAPDLFKEIKSKPTSAYMLDANRIVVSFAQGQGSTEQQFAGTSAEMVTIQKTLNQSGIKTDKLTKLDQYGVWALDWAKKDGRPLPESLRD